LFPILDRVYDNRKARVELGWNPKYDFKTVIQLLMKGQEPRSELARLIGKKGYHPEKTLHTITNIPYPVEIKSRSTAIPKL